MIVVVIKYIAIPVISSTVAITGADIIDGSTSNFLNNIGINPPITAPTIIFINNDTVTTNTIFTSFINKNTIILTIKLHIIPVITPTSASHITLLKSISLLYKLITARAED